MSYLRTRILHVLINNTPPKYLAMPEDLSNLVTALIRELETWDTLMHILDSVYPATVFPTLPDIPDRDPGPRIVSLLRTINEIRKADDE